MLVSTIDSVPGQLVVRLPKRSFRGRARTMPDGPSESQQSMIRRSCDGAGLLAAFRAAVAHLEVYRDDVNALNVFPVPDGDTGSNMVATVNAALEEAQAVAGQPADRIAAAISFGSLMG